MGVETLNPIDQIMADLANEKADKERRHREALAARELEHAEPENQHLSELPAYSSTVFTFDLKTEKEQILRELESETSKKQSYREKVIQQIVTEDGSLLYSVPYIRDYLEVSWQRAEFEMREPDEIVDMGDRRAVGRIGSHVELSIEQDGNGGFAVEMIDRTEHPLTRLRLNGFLTPLPDDESSMHFRDNAAVFIHPAAKGVMDKSLEQMETVLKSGRLINAVYPQE